MGAFREFFEKLYKEGIQDPLSLITEKLEELKPDEGFVQSIVEKLFMWLKPKLIEDLRVEIAVKSLKPEYFSTPEMQEKIAALKEEWSGSPESGSDIAHSLMELVKGQAAQLQLEAISGITIDEETPISDKLFKQLGIITDISLATELISIIGEILSIGQIDKLGPEIRAYLDYSGLTQITGFGYGMLFSTVLSPLITQEINAQMQSIPLDPDRATVLWYRGRIDDDTYRNIMLKHGYGETQQEQYKKSLLFYPSAQDLVTWQAREVYEPEMVAKYGLKEELEGLEREPFYKAGVDDEQIENYWIAHWQHPDWYRIREMLFRTDFTEADMWDWFRTVEIPPYWREKFIATAYNPLTRVDLRRLYRDGVADRERVKKGYMELGSSEEHAEELTVWTENAYAPKERELAKGEVLKNYRIGDATADTVKEMLIRLGYTEDQITWILVYEDYKVSEDEKTQEAETIITEVINGSITLKQAVEGFGTLKLSQKRMNSYIARAKREARKLTHVPPIATLKKWFKEGIINAEEFTERMYAHKVSKEDIDRYMKEAGGE